jgi:hypothetical protein
MNRRSDRLWLLTAILGSIVVLATIYLRFVDHALSDVSFGLGLVIGAGLVSPQFIVDMILRWRAGK